MAKRFVDTERWRKKFRKSLPGAYKLLWDYILDDCNHAGIWHVDFDIARIMIGPELKIYRTEAEDLFKDKIIIFDDDEKWFIPSFVDFQYGSQSCEQSS